MLNRKSLRLITLFIVLLLPGVFFGNLVLVAMSLVPLALLLAGMALSVPRPVCTESERVVSPVWAGDEVAIVRRVAMSSGIGLLRLRQPLPAQFALVKGSNVVLHWAGFKPGRVEISLRVRLDKRGHYSLQPLEWISQHPLGLLPERGTMGECLGLEVWPRFYRPTIIKNLPGLSVSPLPSADIAKIGIPGQDFREIRKYVSGDPIKNINWRATARRAEQSMWPLVNEFEREGRKSVLIYLHASRTVEVGNTIRDGLECGLEAAANLLFYYLEKGHRTGIYICADPHHYFSPDTGRIQFRNALRCLTDLKPAYEAKELLSAVERTKDYVLGYNPLAILITTLDTRSTRTVETAVQRIRQMYGQRRRPSLMVVAIDAYDMIPQEAHYEGSLGALMRLEARSHVRRLRSYGADVVEWRPDRETFANVFSRQVVR